MKEVAVEIQASIKRPRDLAARFGGEEFVVLLPETDLNGASHVAKRLVDHVEKLSIAHQSSLTTNVVTISVGVASIIPKEEDAMDMLLSYADDALYRAKAAGKNCFREYCEK